MLKFPREQIGAVILAGGKGRRLGRDKTAILLNGESIISRLISFLNRLRFQEIVVVYGTDVKPSEQPAREVKDLLPGRGSLGGIYTGLTNSSGEFTFVMACDMPFPSSPLILYLLDRAVSGEYDCVIPSPSGRLEPLFAVYRKTCIPVIREQINNGDLKISGILPSLHTLVITDTDLDRFDPEHLSFFNINTPDDLIQAQTIADKFRLSVDR